jgi:WD40 repeat protein
MPTVAVQGAYTDAIDHAFYATDPRFLLIADTTNKTTELWHLETATPIRTFPVGATAIAQSTISSKLALAADGTISIWDVAGGEKLLDIPGAEHHAESLSFSPDGRYLYGGGDWGVRKWDAVTGEWTGDRKDQYGVPYDVIDNRLRVSQFAFTSDGRRVVAANEFGGMVYIDARSGEQLFSGTTKYISLPGTSICADGRLVAFADFNAGHICAGR